RKALLTYVCPHRALRQQIAICVSIVLYLDVLQFFRNPRVDVQTDEKQVLAPADGRVVAIEQTEETEYLKERRTLVSRFMSPINVHVNRMPVGGVVSFYRYHPGTYQIGRAACRE